MKKYTFIMFHKNGALWTIIHYNNEKDIQRISNLAKRAGNPFFVLYTGSLIPVSDAILSKPIYIK